MAGGATSPPIFRAACKMLVPGSTSIVILSIVTLNNFFSSAIALFFVLLTSFSSPHLPHSRKPPLRPAPLPHRTDPHNAPTRNSAPNTPADYPHATQTHPGNAGSPPPPARPPHRPADKWYYPLSSA